MTATLDPLATLNLVDRRIAAEALGYLRQWFAELDADGLAERAVRREDLLAGLPDPLPLPELRGLKRWVLRRAIDHPRPDLYEAIRQAVGATHPDHADLLALGDVRGWYAAAMDDLRLRILKQLGGG